MDLRRFRLWRAEILWNGSSILCPRRRKDFPLIAYNEEFGYRQPSALERAAHEAVSSSSELKRSKGSITDSRLVEPRRAVPRTRP